MQKPKGAKGHLRVLMRRRLYLKSQATNGDARHFIVGEIEALDFAIECVRRQYSLTEEAVAEIEAQMAAKIAARAAG